MQATQNPTSAPVTVADHPDPLDRDFCASRYERALREDLAVEKLAPEMYAVTNEDGDETYNVDMESGYCGCPDFMYREDTVCKHASRACLEAYYEGYRPLTPFVAKFILSARDAGCVFGADDCNGAAGVEKMPCTDCLRGFDVLD